ncbi:hypothetical protein A9Q84_19765 [Halobacteriovorax marinus]|uniref:DUF192 domain-containing protein n=1 Tax=Halobacteriovorax marinus TaxID=97084 RepID=A0A1Y5F321_9BACT|nr:hypothetical protein A9Q84_19765 [Halobacteriovorax marinus]
MLYEIKFKENILCKKAKIAKSFSDRLVGLMFKKHMKNFDGLLITQCNSIHTMFMRYKLDLIFLDKNLNVIKIIENIKPWRMTLMYFKSTQVLELEGGSLNGSIQKGEQLEMKCIN